jgi:hypothetical protein
MIAFRRSSAPGVPEPAPTEVKVTVTGGGTIDLGTVHLAAP